MNRKAVVVLGALWIMLWVAHLLNRTELLARGMPTLAMSNADRGTIETGDPELHEAIRSGRDPGPRATDFEKFRTAFERYPIDPEAVPKSKGWSLLPILPFAAALALYRGLFQWMGWSRVGFVDRIGMILLPCALAVTWVDALIAHSAWSNWDAWAVWDFKTKAVLHEGWLPASFLTNPEYGFSHPEYPLLWPWLEALASRVFGGFDSRALRLLPLACATAVPFMISALLAEVGVVRGRWLVAGLIATLPKVLDHSSNGYVDWPLAAVESAALLLALGWRRGAVPGWVVGVVAGVAANLKQEGLIFGAGLVAALALDRRRSKAGWKSVGTVAGIFLLLALPWQFYRRSLGISAADFGLPIGAVIAQFPNRTFLFLRGILLEAFGAGPNGGSIRDWFSHLTSTWLVFWFVAGYLILTGWRRLSEPVFRIPLVVLGVQILGAWAAYGLTIRDPQWLITTSLDRLMLQWVPSVTVIAAVLLTRKGGCGVG